MIPFNKELLTGTVPVNKISLAGMVPVNILFYFFYIIRWYFLKLTTLELYFEEDESAEVDCYVKSASSWGLWKYE